jgi:putative FmdB family regulatory protein
MVMPTYEYACSACTHAWEQTQRITEPAVEVCPSCGATTAHRLISGGTNFILKGGGWYSDLYSSAKPKAEKVEKAEKAEKAEPKPVSEGTAKPADSPAKPAAKAAGGESSSTSPSTPSAPTT